MPSAIHLRVAPAGAGWRVTVGDGSTRPVEDLVPAHAIVALQAALAADGPALSPVLLAGRDAAFSRAEDAVGATLAAALSAAPHAWGHLQLLRGRAEAAGAAPTLVVDAEQADLPWELTSLGDGPLESVAGGLVVRLAAGIPTAGAIGPTFAIWTGGEDPITTTLAARLRTALAGLTEVAPDQHPALLWVVAHGARGAEQVAVALGADEVGAGALAARLDAAVRSARAAFLAVCHGGAVDLPRLDGLVGRLLAGGVPVLVAAQNAVPAELVVRFASGVGPALARGETLGAAIGAGRRAVRAWAFPHPLARWTALVCWVRAADALDGVPRPAGWVPPGWSVPDAAAAPWLDGACRDAVRRGDGYVGVEHLLRALLAVDGGGPRAEALRRSAAVLLRPYEDVAAGLTAQPERDGLVPTPRVTTLGADLPHGFGVEALAIRICALATVGGDGGVETEQPLAAPTEPARGLEIVGGPEDGRVLWPSPGDTFGRAGGAATWPLYAGTHLTDRRLSRLHLTWLGDGRIRHPDGTERLVTTGELVTLTAGTRLRGASDDGR